MTQTKKFAAMTGAELYAQIRAMEGAFTLDFTPLTALRDAIRAEALEEVLNKDNAVLRDLEAAIHTYRTRAERAEQERDAALEEVERRRKVYLNIADATLPSSKGPEDVIAEIYRLREAERTAEQQRDAALKARNKWTENYDDVHAKLRSFRAREYPATPSGEGVKVWSCAKCNEMGKVWDGCAIAECGAKIPDGIPRTNLTPATPQPKATGSVGQSVRLYLAIDGEYKMVEFFAEDARRLLALAQTTTEGR